MFNKTLKYLPWAKMLPTHFTGGGGIRVAVGFDLCFSSESVVYVSGLHSGENIFQESWNVGAKWQYESPDAGRLSNWLGRHMKYNYASLSAEVGYSHLNKWDISLDKSGSDMRIFEWFWGVNKRASSGLYGLIELNLQNRIRKRGRPTIINRSDRLLFSFGNDDFVF